MILKLHLAASERVNFVLLKELVLFEGCVVEECAHDLGVLAIYQLHVEKVAFLGPFFPLFYWVLFRHSDFDDPAGLPWGQRCYWAIFWLKLREMRLF